MDLKDADVDRLPVQGPAARMRCQRCRQVFTVRAGHLIAHDRRQGAVATPCDGLLTPVVPRDDNGPEVPNKAE